jgi:preprotein translocase subunit SecF
MHIFKNSHFDFLRWRWHAIILSWVVILAGAGVILTKGIPLGIEFAGGTSIVAKFDQQPTVGQVRDALADRFNETLIQPYGAAADRQMLIRVPQTGAESGDQLAQIKETVSTELISAGLNHTIEKTEIVSPTVGRELTSKGLWATVLSLVGILAYIAFRYQLSFAVGAVVATIHDLLVTMAFLAFFQYDLTLNVIAAILTVTGYSTNDTIVIFDRVRENLRSGRRDELMAVINKSLNQTLGRTVLTAGTAFLSALALFLFGGEVLRGLAFTLIVGIITGTYSSVFVAAAVVTFWRGKGPTRAAAHAPALASGPPQQPTRKAKPQRKVKAS